MCKCCVCKSCVCMHELCAGVVCARVLCKWSIAAHIEITVWCSGLLSVPGNHFKVTMEPDSIGVKASYSSL